jgi:hypothetical protein
LDHDPDLKKLVKKLKAQHSEVYSKIVVEYVFSEELEFNLGEKENFSESFF